MGGNGNLELLHISQRKRVRVCRLRFSDKRLRGFPPHDSCFLNIVDLLVEKELVGCGEKIWKRENYLEKHGKIVVQCCFTRRKNKA